MTGRERMKRMTRGEIGRLRVIVDFLPSPDALVARKNNVKVTLGLSRRSVEFFKGSARSLLVKRR